MKRNHVTGKGIYPNEVVPLCGPVQEGSGVTHIHMMLWRSTIGKKLFGHSYDDRIELYYVKLQFGPILGQPFGKRSSTVAENQRSLRFRDQGERGDHELAVGKKQRDRIGFPHDGVEGAVQHQIAE